MRAWAAFLLALLPGGVAAADEEAAEEIVVWGDLFARWDDTRWFVSTEMALPYYMTLRRDENVEFQTDQVVLRTVIACSKEWKLNKRRYEVGCKLEDFAMRASIAEDVVTEKDVERAQQVLDEIDAKLTDAKLTLQVADDGRVMNIGLDGVPKDDSQRQSGIQETLRQVLSRVVVGFNLKMQKYNQLHEGKWVEYNSTVMDIMPGASGSNMLVHYLNRYRGHVLVQSIGKGTASVENGAGTMNHWETNFIGVSTFDDQEGFMTERVWALDGSSTASAIFDQGMFFNAGKITMLGSSDRPDLGQSVVTNGRHQRLPFLPQWEPHNG
jgi:hypothetical protein